jgi:tetratricopeptide (TPR) repeat protein
MKIVRRSRASAATPPVVPRLSLRKKLLFAAITTLLVFGLLEMLLWAAGVEPAHYREDPYAGFSLHVPHFVPEVGADGQTWLTVSPSKADVLNPQRFLRKKLAQTYRIVCLGGSTTYGRPFFDETSMAGWLRAMLPVADSSRHWEVINAGAISYASYRALGLMQELAKYDPDLYIVDTGHNEFLERRTYEGLAGMPSLVTNSLALVFSRRTTTAVRGLLDLCGVNRARPFQAAGVLGERVQRIPLNAVGPEAYHRDDDFTADVVQHFRATLERMVRIARSAGAELLLVAPGSNLADFVPFKSEHRVGLSDADRTHWKKHMESARGLAGDRQHAAALDEIAAAELIDDRHAAMHYAKGQTLRAAGRYDDAKVALRRARDEDICPLRAITPIVKTVRSVAAAHDTLVVDFEQLVDRHSEHGLPGRSMFHDHVHPTIEANRLLAVAIIDLLRERNLIRPTDSWNEQAMAKVTADVIAKLDRPRHAAQLRQLAAMFVWLKQYEMARHQAELSLELSGRTPDALLELAGGVLDEGAPKLAAKYYEEALELDSQSAAAHFGLAMCWLKRGQTERAIEELRTTISLDPDLPAAHARLGLVLADRGELKEAERHLIEAVRLRPGEPQMHQFLGTVMVRQRRLPEAIEHFRRALALDPKHASTHYALGLALELHGEKNEARSHYSQVLRWTPHHAQARTRLQALGRPAETFIPGGE